MCVLVDIFDICTSWRNYSMQILPDIYALEKGGLDVSFPEHVTCMYTYNRNNTDVGRDTKVCYHIQDRIEVICYISKYEKEKKVCYITMRKKRRTYLMKVTVKMKRKFL